MVCWFYKLKNGGDKSVQVETVFGFWKAVLLAATFHFPSMQKEGRLNDSDTQHGIERKKEWKCR